MLSFRILAEERQYCAPIRNQAEGREYLCGYDEIYDFIDIIRFYYFEVA